jgi:hypothetical protein
LGGLVDEESLLLAESDCFDIIALVGKRVISDLFGLGSVLDGLKLIVALANRSII